MLSISTVKTLINSKWHLYIFQIAEKQMTSTPVAAPVKLESLQVLSAMSRNYFDFLMAPHIHHITKALKISFCDKYIDMTLHSGRAVDFIGQAINSYIISEGKFFLVGKSKINKKYCLKNIRFYIQKWK